MSYETQTIQQKADNYYNIIWDKIIQPNQIEISKISDPFERKQMQQQLDTLISCVNGMHNIIEYITNIESARPTKNEYEFVKMQYRAAREYIKILGGNVSNLNYIKSTDYDSK